MKKLFLFAAFLILTTAAYGADAPSPRYLYYSDNLQPLQTKHEPPYVGTRKQIQKESYYLNIRYPYQKMTTEAGDADKGLYMKFSVGSEFEQILQFKVEKLELRYQGRDLHLQPEFYNEDAHEDQKGLDALKNYVYKVPPDVHRMVTAYCKECKQDYESLELEISLTVTPPGRKEESIHETILLYRGFFSEK